MDDPDGLNVTNLKVSTRMVANPAGGGMKRTHVVTYNVGTHGPFEDTYDGKDFTPANVKATLTKQVQNLREINQAAKAI